MTSVIFRYKKLLDWVGLKNFSNIVQLSTFRKAFSNVLSWTFIWTICASSLQIVIGVATAIIANQKFIKFKRIFRGYFHPYHGLYLPSSPS